MLVHCLYCNKVFIPDIAGLQPAVLKINEDQFILHDHCVDEIVAIVHKLEGAKLKNFITDLLRKLGQ